MFIIFLVGGCNVCLFPVPWHTSLLEGMVTLRTNSLQTEPIIVPMDQLYLIVSWTILYVIEAFFMKPCEHK